VKAVMSGKSEYRDLTLEAINRRGSHVRCRVTCTPRLGAKKEVKGVILLMEQLGEPTKKEA
jgi:two-component system CheB/CheR fusion protein